MSPLALLADLAPERPRFTDLPAVGLLVVATAFLVAAHVACALRVRRAHGAGAALLAFVLVPLAPVRAFRSGARVAPGVWVLAALAYGVARVLASRG